MDFSLFSAADLRDLESKLKLEIKKREHEEMLRARLQIIAIAQNAGIPLQDLVDGASKNRRTGPPRGTKVGIKFRHPQFLHLTWSGRGRQPVWLRQALADGISWSALTVDLLPV